MDALRKEAVYTIEDIYALPDGERAELIDGKIYYMAPPSTNHQRLVKNFTYSIENYIRNHNGSGEVFPSPFAVFLNEENDKNYVEPDISVVCDKDKITGKGCNGAPDWIIEIVSPISRQMDYYKKLFQYRTVGVREYWVVDPDKQLVIVYNFEKDTMEEFSFGNDVPVGIYEDFSINIKSIK
ncbi:MAG: Uma2 family endonuclease [Lachnospiraceae bacterium]|nr:Uma2 family endonuclease [Lachnospiraceae bacterium]